MVNFTRFYISENHSYEKVKNAVFHMNKAMANSPQQLFKILIGVAWLDGQMQEAERAHLLGIAQAQNLAEDPEISGLLQDLGQTAIPPAQCYQWVQDYLGAQPDDTHYEQLLEALGGIIYSDNDVAIDEANLLNNLTPQSFEQPIVPRLSIARSLLARLHTAYQQWIAR
jgi:uncharacterized tellurite resistance protein B-like protein